MPAAPRPAETAAYVAPFAVFIVFIGIRSYLPFGPVLEYPLRVLLVSAVVLAVSRPALDLRLSRAFGSVVLGIAVFAIWIGPDLLWPNYRGHWLFKNPLTGGAAVPLPLEARSNGIFLAFRIAGTAGLVPVIEELFWRGWLMRWLIAKDFASLPLGAYRASSFWITALLFASEHGGFWGVGLLAGVAYNWWMVRTRSLTDCILAHAVTNACLAGYVLSAGKWEYWL